VNEATTDFLVKLDLEISEADRQGTYKRERILMGAQASEIEVNTSVGRSKVLNFCSNNYLGLAGHPEVARAAVAAIKKYGVGMASVRFICGTQDLHKELEFAIADYVRQDDAILFPACFDANGGVFEPLFGPEDAIISDSLNHASIIDGIRLCKAQRYRYSNGDMDDLESKLRLAETKGAHTKIIVTDGVFSMDGFIAPVDAICDLADRYGALVMVDDCHATGVLGEEGRGTAEHRGAEHRPDIITGTFGKALSGSMGGFVAGRRQIVEMLRQRSRPYLFSNSLAPPLAGASLKAIEIAKSGNELRRRLFANAAKLREGLENAGFDLLPGQHPIIPVMIGDAGLSRQMADLLLDERIYVMSFSYPVVPEGSARTRLQVSAAHTSSQIEAAIAAFQKVGRSLGLV
jgi:glycine C-acetyltransferase